MNKIYVIDAVNYLFRSYYAIGPMTNGQGQSTSALYGFIRSVQKLIRQVSPQYMICVFDGPDNKKARQDLYAEYKSHRVEAPQDLFPQFDWAHIYCALSGIPVLCIPGVEADDVMASIAIWAEQEGMESYLCTSDKDLAQLVNDHIFVLQPHKDYALVDAAKVEEIYGVKPSQVRDFLAITGDASDNIPGVPGMGPKTAAALLQEFGSLEEIFRQVDQVKGEKKQQKLKENKEMAFLSQALVELNTHVEIPHAVSFYAVKATDSAGLRQFYHKMQFRTLLREMEEEPLPIEEKKGLYHLVDTEEKMVSFLSHLEKAKEIGIDTETTNIHPMRASLVGVSFAIESHEAWYVPCGGEIDPRLRFIFEKKGVSFYGHNLKYDFHIFANLGIFLRSLSFDTMIASYILDPQSRRHDLDDLILDHCKHAKISLETLVGKGKTEISIAEAPLEKVKEYGCEAIDYTTRLKQIFEKELEKRGLQSILETLEMPLLPVLAKMERSGIYLDTARLAEIGKTLLEEQNKLKEKIFQATGEEFNLNSPKQLSEMLFEKLKLKKPSGAKSSFATGAEVLEELAEEAPIATDILKYRSLEKLRATYIDSLPQEVFPKTGRIHCTFNQSVAATGRLSCQDPNLQNIPVRTKEGNSIRSCFKPEKEGWSFIGGDYSQIELRLLAHFSEDPELIKAFLDKEDIHAHTASRIFNLPITMITPDMRSAAKTVNFGILYGQGPFGLSKGLHISVKEASDFIKTYFERYPGILNYLEHCKGEARRLGVAKTLLGRERPIPEIHNKNPQIRAAAERLAINTPLQGTAADLIKQAMISIDREIVKRNLKGFMILQVHDELIFEVPDAEIPVFERLIQDHMEKVFELKVPIEVKLSIGKNWAEC